MLPAYAYVTIGYVTTALAGEPNHGSINRVTPAVRDHQMAFTSQIYEHRAQSSLNRQARHTSGKQTQLQHTRDSSHKSIKQQQYMYKEHTSSQRSVVAVTRSSNISRSVGNDVASQSAGTGKDNAGTEVHARATPWP